MTRLLYALLYLRGAAGGCQQLEGKWGEQMADVLIIQADGETRSLLGHVLEEDGFEVAFAPDTVAALAPLYLNPYPLVVIVDGASIRADPATLDLVAADFGPLGRHRYIVLAEPHLDESLSLAASPMAFVTSHVVRKPATAAAIRELVARFAPRLPDLTPDPGAMEAVSGQIAAAASPYGTLQTGARLPVHGDRAAS